MNLNLNYENNGNAGYSHNHQLKNYKYNNTQESSNISNNNVNRSRLSSATKENKNKIYRYGMSFDEWTENKNKQLQTAKNLNTLKEQELKEYTKIEEKIEQNYKKIKYY